MFEIIQLLRQAERPLTAQALARTLEVAKRTVYRDIAALAAMRVPIEGAAGVGYIMRPGYDLPPLMFTADEVEAIAVSLSLLGRTGDTGLQAAAERVGQKISSVLPGNAGRALGNPALHASRWHAIPLAGPDPGAMRQAIRDEAKISICYQDPNRKRSLRIVKPLALVYYIESVVLAAWCEQRRDFRHFRLDRITAWQLTGEAFCNEGEALRVQWRKTQNLP